MITMKQYIEVNNLDTKRYGVNEEGEKEEMTQEELDWRYHAEYLHYVHACIYDKK